MLVLEGALDALIPKIDKDIKKDLSQYWALCNTSWDWPPMGLTPYTSISLGLAIQPVFLPLEGHAPLIYEQEVSSRECYGSDVGSFN